MPFTQLKVKNNDEFKKRLLIFSAIPGAFFFIFIIVLFSLQIIKGPDYELKAKINREQFSILPAIRGVIYDRGGKTILAYNRRSFAVSIVPQNLPTKNVEKDNWIYALFQILGTLLMALVFAVVVVFIVLAVITCIITGEGVDLSGLSFGGGSSSRKKRKQKI